MGGPGGCERAFTWGAGGQGGSAGSTEKWSHETQCLKKSPQIELGSLTGGPEGRGLPGITSLVNDCGAMSSGRFQSVLRLRELPLIQSLWIDSQRPQWDSSPVQSTRSSAPTVVGERRGDMLMGCFEVHSWVFTAHIPPPGLLPLVCP